jgi:hypothetical protein
MAKVNMNSTISTQPAMNGPANQLRAGFRMRNPNTASLYKRGDSPRKLSPKACRIVFAITIPLEVESFGKAELGRPINAVREQLFMPGVWLSSETMLRSF